MKTDRITARVILDKRILRKDNSHPIKLRLTFKGERHYYSCSYSATIEEWKRINSESAKGKLRKIKNEIGLWEIKAQKTAEQISPFSFDRFEDFISGERSQKESGIRND